MRKIITSLFALVAIACSAAIAQQWAGFPILGGASYCSSTVNGVCVNTVPAGPTAVTGLETVPVDTNAAGGQNPQTVKIPLSALIPNDSPRNALIGGDFATNLWQRGTTPVSAGTPTVQTQSADNWFTFSTGNTVTISKQTGASDTVPTVGLLASMRVNRPSGTDVTPICVGQFLDAKAAARFTGNTAVFSSYLLAGSTFSATNSAVTMTIATVTAADSATPNTNTATFALSTTTGYTAQVATLTPITTTFTRYSVSASIPATATGIGVKICYTPVGTGASTDWFEVAGVQLEAFVGTTNVAPTVFENRPQALENQLAYYYTWGPGIESIGNFYAAGGCAATGNANFSFQSPVSMRTTPTTATSLITAGTYSIQTAVAVTGAGTITVSTASTPQFITINSTAACTATLPYQFVGGAGATGRLLFSALP